MTANSNANLIVGTDAADTIDALAGNDTLHGRGGDDSLQAGLGRDTVYGGEGRDRIVGDIPETAFKTDVISIAEKYPVKVTFDFEEAGYRNSLGVYKVDPTTGAIRDVRLMWENASLAGSGGDLVGGQSSYAFDVSPGEQIGFFLVGNGFSSNNFAKLGAGEFRFVDSAGKAATVDTAGARLVHVAPDGKVTAINGPTYHTAAFGGRAKLNSDGIEHTMGYMKGADGSIRIGFEDLWKGGDRDFDDAVFTVDIGQANAAVLNQHYQSTLAPQTDMSLVNARSHFQAQPAEDRLEGGGASDTIEGMQGNDLLSGGGAGREWQLVNGKWVFDPKAIKPGAGFVADESDDALYGGTGDDVLLGGRGKDLLEGGAGNDTLNAGMGDDLARGGDGNDVLNLEDGNDFGEGGAGNDVVNAGAGDDVAFGGEGADSLRGALGNDQLSGDAGKDELFGAEDDDTLDGGADDDKLFGGVGNDSLSGGAGADYVEGGAGDDSLDGGEGNDRMIAGEGNDMLTGGAGADTQVGGAGRDTLGGDAGSDQLWGGNWSRDGTGDVFAHRAGAGRDTVMDFEAKLDQIDLSAYNLTYADLAARMVERNGATEISLAGLPGTSAEDALVLKSVRISDLTEDRFIL